MNETTYYDDGEIALDETGVLIRRYYPWGSKPIPYASIKAVTRLPTRARKWRLWGSGDLRHWWNLDPHRRQKDVALVLDTGGWIRPSITPGDVEAVERILKDHSGRPSSVVPSPSTG